MTYPKELIDKWRDVHVDCTYWHEDIIDRWKKELLPKFGIDCTEINFTGFWSQGDGASFTGMVTRDERFLTLMTGSTQSYPFVRKMLADDMENICIKIERIRGARYYHECSVGVEIESATFVDLAARRDESEDDDALAAIYEVWDTVLTRELGDLEDEAQAYVRKIMCRIYEELQAEFEYLTSDETITEWLDANPDVWKEDAAA